MTRRMSLKSKFELEEVMENNVLLKTFKHGKNIMDVPVFFNPKMKLNRDLSVLSLNYLAQEMNLETFLDLMSATGSRGLRVLVETPINEVHFNDINPLAIEIIKENIKINKERQDLSRKRWQIYQEDANQLCWQLKKELKFIDVIDLDPFGTPAPFLESVFQCISKNGILYVTATDMPPLCGIYKEAALKKYGSFLFKTEYCHEIAVRTLLKSLALAAAKFEFAFQPLLSLSIDHYVRVIVKIKRLQQSEKWLSRNLGHVAHCKNCNEHGITRLDPIDYSCSCKHEFSIMGPLWIGKLHDERFVKGLIDLQKDKQIIKKDKRIVKVLEMILKEVNLPPLYHDLHRIAEEVGTSVPPKRAVIKEIQQMTHVAGETHFSPTSIKTDLSRKELKKLIIKLTSK